jgi:hypothetical protein
MVADRFTRTHPAAVFPAFWEAGFDWIPDQDNGGVASLTLQLMLLRWNGNEIHLLPAWPQAWDVNFKLHAPFNTIIEGRVSSGKLTAITVTPQSRLKNVIVCRPYSLPQTSRDPVG